MTQQIRDMNGRVIWKEGHRYQRRDRRGRFSIAGYLSYKLSQLGRAIRWALIRLSIIGIAAGTLSGAYFWGITNATTTVDYQLAPAIVQQNDMAPVLARIALAESHGSQTCTKAIAELHYSPSCNSGNVGQVMMHANTDGSVDIGKYGINSYAWGAEASKLGLDLTKEADNEKMAQYIFNNYGSEPWYSSKRNWIR